MHKNLLHKVHLELNHKELNYLLEQKKKHFGYKTLQINFCVISRVATRFFKFFSRFSKFLPGF